MIQLAPQSKLMRPHAEVPEQPREAALEMEAKEAEEESKESSIIGLQEIKIIMSKVIPKKAHRENCKSGFQHKPHQTNGIAIPKDQSSRREKLRQPYGKPQPPNKTLRGTCSNALTRTLVYFRKRNQTRKNLINWTKKPDIRHYPAP